MKGVKGQKGQMAIFIALIFQVLFVFFAMVVNVGLLVHHKINLQNSVDLAAYYGALKQAEQLNAIAHVNYQIRQSWKLLTWRYRVLGNTGLNVFPANPAPPPINPDPSGNDELFKDVTTNKEMTSSFCAAHWGTWGDSPLKPLAASGLGQNLCQQSFFAPVGLPPVQLVGFQLLGFTFGTANLVNNFKRIAQSVTANCKWSTAINWAVPASMYIGYRLDQGNRKKVIFTLANNLSKSTDGFIDLDGINVRDGVKNTLDKNLTEPNRQGLGDFRVFNSLAASKCAGTSGNNNEPPRWLSKINIDPVLYYHNGICVATTDNAYSPAFLTTLPSAGMEYLNTAFTPDQIKQMVDRIKNSEDANGASLGVEKNPWCMAYFGVTASSRPSLPFMPGGVELRATGFAKPFGGKIGPWYHQFWPASSDRSNGGEEIDPLVPPRDLAAATYADPNDKRRFPNYSRYVGDAFGLKSRLTLKHTGQPLNTTYIQTSNYLHLIREIDDNQNNPDGDVLPWDVDSNKPPMPQPPPPGGGLSIRTIEEAAIAPDIFDVTYYSIEPNFGRNYLPRLQKVVGSLNPKVVVRGDLGSRLDVDNLKNFSVREQLASRNAVFGTVLDKLAYEVKDWHNVLTGWSVISSRDFSFKAAEFGKCNHEVKEDPNIPPVPGSCAQGSRTGYSVKLVSKDYLSQKNLKLGGAGASAGPLWNPPPSDW